MNTFTLASAKHLLTQGHITPQHHARIVASVKPAAPKRKPAVRSFGSLAQQAQAPIPGSGEVPDGTATGY